MTGPSPHAGPTGSNPLELGKRVLTNSKHTYNAAQAKLPTFLFFAIVICASPI